MGLLKMLSGFLGGSPIFSGIFLAIFLSMAGLLAYQTQVAIPALKVEVQKEANRAIKFETQLDGCKDKIELINDRIDDLALDREDRDKLIGTLNDSLASMREFSNDRIKDILDAPTPENCADAMTLLRRGIGEFR